MIKIIIKETGIVLLLLIIIGLVLGIIFYDYMPNSKSMPLKTKAYALPEDIKEEITSENPIDEQNIVRTFYIDSKDAYVYESSSEYETGKVNPFSSHLNKLEEDNEINNTIDNSINKGNLFNTIGK